MTDAPVRSDAPESAPIATAARSDASPAPPSAQDFELLLRDVLAPAFGAALHLARNRQDAEDLVQDASLLAFRAFASFQPGTNFKAWFFRILINRFYTLQRRRRPESSMDEVEEVQPLFLYERAEELGMHERRSDPARLLLGRLAAEDVQRALAALPDEFRVVCSLYFIEDFSYQEIADMVGVPLGTVRSRLHRGRRLLQKALWIVAQDQGLVPAGSGPAETREREDRA